MAHLVVLMRLFEVELTTAVTSMIASQVPTGQCMRPTTPGLMPMRWCVFKIIVTVSRIICVTCFTNLASAVYRWCWVGSPWNRLSQRSAI